MPTAAFKTLEDQSQGKMTCGTFTGKSKGTVCPKAKDDKIFLQMEYDDRISAIFLSLNSTHFTEPIKGVVPSVLTKPKDADAIGLTKRELEILKWLGDGKTTWETAKILNRSERVIKYHVRNIQHKLNAMNRTHAVAIALRKGIIR